MFIVLRVFYLIHVRVGMTHSATIIYNFRNQIPPEIEYILAFVYLFLNTIIYHILYILILFYMMYSVMYVYSFRKLFKRPGKSKRK